MKHLLWADTPLLQGDTEAALAYNTDKSPHQERAIWETSVYPLGNGRLGCTVFGDPRCERVQFNQDSLWVGNEDNTGAYQPFGDIYIETGHEQFSHYRRELDIHRAVQRVTYVSGGVHYTREFFASYPAQVVVVHFTADQPGALSGTISLGSLHEVPIEVEEATLVMKGDTRDFWYWTEHLATPERRLSGRAFASEDIIPLDFEARVNVLHSGGSIAAKGNRVVFKQCDRITLLLAADTNYLADREKGWRGEHPHEPVAGLITAAAPRSFDELLQEHVADYQSVFNRLTLDLGESPPAVRAVPTAQRVEAYAAAVKAGRKADDRELETLLYDYARYLMICSSRPGHGALPANLQGLWLMNKRPSWRCDFHTDVNLQMNYWFTQAANLADCFEPYAHWVDSIREVRKEETRRVLGVKRGWLMRSENGIFGGSTWHFQKGDSAWLCQNLWDHFTFTRDEAYLARYAYPVMKEISEFWLDHLKALPDGTLVAPGGRSPEHGPVDVDGVTYDQVLCWDLFNNTIEAGEILGVDAAFRQDVISKRDRLLSPQIGKWGQLQEWMEDQDDPEDDHRHVNHLICVYPGRQVHPHITPALAEAARVGVAARHRCGKEHPGWSKVWKSCMFARLLDGETAYELLADLMATKVYGNLWTTHPPFQIDANFGYAAAVNEMLVQSHLEEIHLLPALPEAWQTGSVKGLRVRGGYELDMAWEGGRLTRAVLRGVSNGAEHCVVRYGDTTRTVDVKPGVPVSLLG